MTAGQAERAGVWAVACFIALATLARETVAGPASHVRLRTEHGPVHVWTPRNYDLSTAGIVVYVHGYFANVDDAWREHRLARQFAASRLNALFIACEAPRGPRDPVRWTSIDAMLDALGDVAGDLPEGRVIAVGHSGAHRTLSMWLADERIDTIVLVDALYGEMPGLAAWLDGREGRRLIDVAVLTREWADELHAEIRDTVALRRIPAVGTSKHRKARVARVVYMRSQQDHMQLVTGGIALPRLLRALQLPLVAQTRKRSSHAM